MDEHHRAAAVVDHRGYGDGGLKFAGRPEQPGETGVRLPDGSPTAWVLSPRPVYEYLLEEFAVVMGTELADRGRCAEAGRLATATLVVAPDDVQACVLFVLCSARAGDWDAARAVIERSLRALAAAGQTSPTLHLHYGEVLMRLGDPAGARREYEALGASDDEIGAEARRRLERMR